MADIKPPFTEESARKKVKAAQNLWNSQYVWSPSQLLSLGLEGAVCFCFTCDFLHTTTLCLQDVFLSCLTRYRSRPRRHEGVTSSCIHFTFASPLPLPLPPLLARIEGDFPLSPFPLSATHPRAAPFHLLHLHHRISHLSKPAPRGQHHLATRNPRCLCSRRNVGTKTSP